MINGGKMYLRKGDHYKIEVTILDSAGEEYEMEATDTLTFTVKRLPVATETALLTVNGTAGSNVIEFDAALDVGVYSGDVQLNAAGGKKYTVWPAANQLAAHGVAQNLKNVIVDPEVTGNG